MSSPTHDHAALAANAAVAFSWSGYIVSHITQINAVLQSMTLIASIVVSVSAFIYYRRNTPKR